MSNTDTTTTKSGARQTADKYAIELNERLTAILRRRFGDRDVAHDVASAETLRFLERPEAIMAKYPNARTYAAARATHGRSDHFRRHRAQRCEGARVTEAPDATWRLGKRVEAGDAVDEETGATLWDTTGDKHDVAAEVVGREASDHLMALLTVDQLEIVRRVVADDQTVTSVAAELGIARETAQRKLGRALVTMRVAAGQWSEAA